VATEAELRAAQALRYRVFYDEQHAVDTNAARSRLDADPYDPVCDHLLVIDHSEGRVVGAYRLLRQVIAEQHSGFYSSREFDLRPLLTLSDDGGPGQLLELGRSCVDPAYRNSATISMLWRGIASYLELHRIRFMFGCASFPGTQPDDHAASLSYLFHHHLAPVEMRARALATHHVEMNRMPAERLDGRAAERGLPPLIRGYLRVGAMVGDGAFVDRQFNTVDVFVVMPVDRIAQRYAQRFTFARTGETANFA
jgi:L-ornithine Nalpha-acyltransferase